MAALVGLPLAVTSFTAQAGAQAPACAPAVEFAAEAAVMARRCGGRVEIASLATGSTQVWVNPDGTRTAALHAGIERIRRDGQWQTVDLTLVRQGDGSVRPKVHPHDLAIAGPGGTGMDRELAAITVAGQRVGLGWSARLPEPSLAENTATYREVLPGVDLVVEATVSGFEQFLVVKERAAAPRVARLRQLTLRTGAHEAHTAADGSVIVRGPGGKTVARMPAPVMWDATVSPVTGDHTRVRRFAGGLSQTRRPGGRELEFTPDMAFLTDPATRYPVTLDPGISAGLESGYDAFVQNTWPQDQNDATELRLGYSNDGGSFKARSYLRFDGLARFAGAKIHSAHLRLWNTHSWSCTARGWRATRTAWFASATWGSQPSWYEDDAVSTETTGHDPQCGDGWVKTEVDNVLDDAFAAGDDSVGMVLKAEFDNNKDNFSVTDPLTWKKFNSHNAGWGRPWIELFYNHVPAVPTGATVHGDGRCGTGEADRVVLAGRRPIFAADLADADTGQQLTLAVRLNRSDSRVVSGQTGATGRHTVTWPADLGDGVYTVEYQARDGADVSEWSRACQFEINNDPPEEPPVDAAPPSFDDRGTGVLVRLKPAPGDGGEVAGYRFGDDPARLGAIAPAGPDGTATIHVTNATTANVESLPLYVKAVNRAGARNPDDPDGRVRAYQLDLPKFTPTTRTPGDVTGDGRADVVSLADVGGGHAILQLVTGGAGGAASGVLHPFGQTPWRTAATTVLTGDVDNDGLTDIVLVTDGGSGQVAVQVARSTGYTWGSVAVTIDRAFPLADTKPLVADFTGDGKADLGFLVRTGPMSWDAVVRASTSPPGGVSFGPSKTWLTNPGSDWSKLKLVAGRFGGGTDNKDSRADLAYLYDYGGCHSKVWVHQSQTGDTFQPPTTEKWDGGPGNVCWANSTLAVGDYTGDGRDDLLSSYDLGRCATRLWSWVPDGAGALTGNLLWTSTQPWCAGLSTLHPGDFDVDGKVDLAVTYRCCGAYQSRLWRFGATGAGLVAPALMWEGASGPPGVAGAPRNLVADAVISASSSAPEDWGWAPRFVNDGQREGIGWGTWSSTDVDHTEWLELAFPGGVARTVNRVDLYPRSDPGFAGQNFPANFTIDVWTGSAWQTVVAKTGYPNPGAAVQRFVFPGPRTTSRIRIQGTSLRLMQFAEVEAYLGNLAGATVTASSSAPEEWGWAPRFATDGLRDGIGWGTWSSTEVDHTEWVEFALPTARTANRIDLYPRSDAPYAGDNFPANLTIEVFTGSAWVTVASRTGHPATGGARQSFSFATRPVSKIRITGTSLRLMQFAEVELHHN